MKLFRWSGLVSMAVAVGIWNVQLERWPVGCLNNSNDRSLEKLGAGLVYDDFDAARHSDNVDVEWGIGNGHRRSDPAAVATPTCHKHTQVRSGVPPFLKNVFQGHRSICG